MKKCRRCTKPATYHVTELRNGKVQALHLCQSCAEEYLNTVDVVGGSNEEGAAAEPTGSSEGDTHDGLECPHCGITFKQFRSQGRLGCPHDYQVFHDELVPLLESIHNETQHIGKIPRQIPDVSRRQYELIRLRNELKAAVQNEQYEEAARLRDQIRTTEAELEA